MREVTIQYVLKLYPMLYDIVYFTECVRSLVGIFICLYLFIYFLKTSNETMLVRLVA